MSFPRSISLAKRIDGYSFHAAEDAAINRAIAAVGGPVRDPLALLNALARLEVALPFGLESLPLIATIAGLRWCKELFPMSAGDFRKMVAAVALGAAIESSEINAELLQYAEACSKQFPVTYGSSKALSFLRNQSVKKTASPPRRADKKESRAVIADDDDERQEDQQQQQQQPNEQVQSEGTQKDNDTKTGEEERKESVALTSPQQQPPPPPAPASYSNDRAPSSPLNRSRSVRFLNSSHLSPEKLPSSPSSSSSEDDEDMDPDDPVFNNSTSTFGSFSNLNNNNNSNSPSVELHDALYKRACRNEQQETVEILKDLFHVPRPMQRRKSSAKGAELGKEPESLSSPTAVCFSADKVGTFFENFGIDPKGMLNFFEDPDEMERVVRSATTAGSLRRQMRALGRTDSTAGDQQSDLGDTSGMLQSPSRRLSMAAFSPFDLGAAGGTSSSAVGPSAMADFPTSTAQFGSALNTSLAARRQSFAFGGSHSGDVLAMMKSPLTTTAATTATTGSSLSKARVRNPANAVIEVELTELSEWLNTKSSGNEGWNTPRRAARAIHRWRVSVFAILQTVRSSSAPGASSFDCIGETGGGGGGLAGFARQLFLHQRDNRLESQVLSERLEEIKKDGELRHRPYAKLTKLTLLPELGDVSGVIDQMKYDRTSVEMMLRRMCVPCFGSSGVADLSRRIVQHRVHRGATDPSLVVRVPTKEEMRAITELPQPRGCGFNSAGMRAMLRQEMRQKSDVVERLLMKGAVRGPSRALAATMAEREEEARRRKEKQRAAGALKDEKEKLVFYRRLSETPDPAEGGGGMGRLRKKGATASPMVVGLSRPGSAAMSRGGEPTMMTITSRQQHRLPARRPVSALRRAVAEAMAHVAPENPKAPQKQKEINKEKKDSNNERRDKTALIASAAANEDDSDSVSSVSSYSPSSSPTPSSSGNYNRTGMSQRPPVVVDPRSSATALGASSSPTTAVGLPPKAPRSLDSSTNNNNNSSVTAPHAPADSSNMRRDDEAVLYADKMRKWVSSVDPIVLAEYSSSAASPAAAAAAASASHSPMRVSTAAARARPGTATNRRAAPFSVPTEEQLRHVVPAAEGSRKEERQDGGGGGDRSPLSSSSLRRKGGDSPPQLSLADDFGDKPCRTRAKLDNVVQQSRESELKKLAAQKDVERMLIFEIQSEKLSVAKKIGKSKFGNVQATYGAKVVRHFL